jgi:hypothetical protein
MIDFSCSLQSFGYIPNVKLFDAPFPLLACDVDNLCQDLIGWYDPSRCYDYHNLIFDVPWDGMPRQKRLRTHATGKLRIADHSQLLGTEAKLTRQLSNSAAEICSPPVFSIIRHYPVSWHEDLIKKAAGVYVEE